MEELDNFLDLMEEYDAIQSFGAWARDGSRDSGPLLHQQTRWWLVRSRGALPSWYLLWAGGWLAPARSCPARRWLAGQCCSTGLMRAACWGRGRWSESAGLRASRTWSTMASSRLSGLSLLIRSLMRPLTALPAGGCCFQGSLRLASRLPLV